MKRNRTVIISFLSVLLSLGQGCDQKHSDFVPLQGGFGTVTKWVGIDSGPGAALYYKGNQSKPSLIWPYLVDGPLLFTNDMVFFIGAAPDTQGALVYDLYLTAQAPGPAIDVSEDLLMFWAESNHIDFAKIRNHYSPLREKAVENGILIDYIGGDEKVPATQATFVISWEQVSNIIQDVKRTGKQHMIDNPVRKLHVVYLKKDYDP
jgi:hypothetical protein